MMKPALQFPSVSPFHQLTFATLSWFAETPLLRWLTKISDEASWHNSSNRPAKPLLRSRTICSLIHPEGLTSPNVSHVNVGPGLFFESLISRCADGDRKSVV